MALNRDEQKNIIKLWDSGYGQGAIRRETGHSRSTINRYLRAEREVRGYKFITQARGTAITVEAQNLARAKEAFKETHPTTNVREIWVCLEAQEKPELARETQKVR